jgi:enoyl-CoA hydratase/carnithine racemase
MSEGCLTTRLVRVRSGSLGDDSHDFEHNAEARSGSEKCYSDETPLIGLVGINNPRRSNALSSAILEQFPQSLKSLEQAGARCLIIHQGGSKHFCAGLDIETLQSVSNAEQHECPARHRRSLRRYITDLQNAINSIEECQIPVIACIDGACIGAGVDLITACDIRIGTRTSTFSVKEVDLGIVPDMGTLSRLPSIVGMGVAAWLSLTAKTISGEEAYRIHLLTSLCDTKSDIVSEAFSLAGNIAQKSPVAIAGTKELLLYQRDHSVNDSLRYVSMLNSILLPGSIDIKKIFSGKRPITFSKL